MACRCRIRALQAAPAAPVRPRLRPHWLQLCPGEGLVQDAARWTQRDPLVGRISSQGVVGTFSWDWEAEPWKTEDIKYGSRKKQ